MLMLLVFVIIVVVVIDVLVPVFVVATAALSVLHIVSVNCSDRSSFVVFAVEIEFFRDGVSTSFRRIFLRQILKMLRVFKLGVK